MIDVVEEIAVARVLAATAALTHTSLPRFMTDVVAVEVRLLVRHFRLNGRLYRILYIVDDLYALRTNLDRAGAVVDVAHAS